MGHYCWNGRCRPLQTLDIDAYITEVSTSAPKLRPLVDRISQLAKAQVDVDKPQQPTHAQPKPSLFARLARFFDGDDENDQHAEL
mmetsp:Transcript_27912/g.60497  ORF Transcript_27912/g.60497 Transcript_27912/m.60497 type:complete len:85 (-) Transcript_27912:44-298(-)